MPIHRPDLVNAEPEPLDRLTQLLARLPSVGHKSAYRMALYILRSDPDYARALSQSIVAARSQLQECERCCDLTHSSPCRICLDPKRDPRLLCVVAQPQDRVAIDRTRSFSGCYHVLHGVLDPLAGVGPSQLRIQALLERLRDNAIQEVIVATSPNVEGDATALYLSKLVSPLGVRVSRIASGLAVGGQLEYADASMLQRAFEARQPLG